MSNAALLCPALIHFDDGNDGWLHKTILVREQFVGAILHQGGRSAVQVKIQPAYQGTSVLVVLANKRSDITPHDGKAIPPGHWLLHHRNFEQDNKKKKWNEMRCSRSCILRHGF